MAFGTEQDTLVGSSLLYLSVDLGERPELTEFGRQIEAVDQLWRHCLELSVSRAALFPGPGEDAAHIDDTERVVTRTPLLITRTKLASPWVSVLTTVAEKSVPVGYGVAAMWGLQRLLTMVMDWQRHRAYLRRQAADLHRQRADALLVEHATAELSRHAAETERHGSAAAVSVDDEAINAVLRLAPIQEATLIDADDPRASGDAN